MDVDQLGDIDQNLFDKSQAITNTEDFKKHYKLPAINVRESVDQNNDLQQKKVSPLARKYASPYDNSNIQKVLKSLNNEYEIYKKGGQIKQIKQQKNNMSSGDKISRDELCISKKTTYEETLQNLAITNVNKIQQYFKIYNPKNTNIGFNQQQIVNKLLQNSKLNSSNDQINANQIQQPCQSMDGQEVEQSNSAQNNTQISQIPLNSVISRNNNILSQTESREDRQLSENSEFQLQFKKQNPSSINQKLRSLSQMNQKKSSKLIEDIYYLQKNKDESQQIHKKKNSKHTLGNINNNTSGNTPIKDRNFETKIQSVQTSNDYKINDYKSHKIDNKLSFIDPENKNDSQLNSVAQYEGVQINKDECSRQYVNLQLRLNTKKNSSYQTTKAHTPNARYQSFIGDYQIENNFISTKTNGIIQKTNDSRQTNDARKVSEMRLPNEIKSAIDGNLINDVKKLNDTKSDNNTRLSNSIKQSNEIRFPKNKFRLSQNQSILNQSLIGQGNFPKKKISDGDIKCPQIDNNGGLSDIKKSLEKQNKYNEKTNNTIKCNTEQSQDSIDNLLEYKVKQIIEKQKMKNSPEKSCEENEELDNNASFKQIKQHLQYIQTNENKTNRSYYLNSSNQQRNGQKQIHSKLLTSLYVEKNADLSQFQQQQKLNNSIVENNISKQFNLFSENHQIHNNSISSSKKGSVQEQENAIALKDIKSQQNNCVQNGEIKQSRPSSIIKYKKMPLFIESLKCNSVSQPQVNERINELQSAQSDILNQNKEQVKEIQQLDKLENKHIIIKTKVINQKRVHTEACDNSINYEQETQNENNNDLYDNKHQLKQRKNTNEELQDNQNRSVSQNIKHLNISDNQIQNKKAIPQIENQKHIQDKKVTQKQGNEVKPKEDSSLQEIKQFRRQKKFEQLMEYNTQQKFQELGRIISKINKSHNLILKKIKDKDFNQVKSVKFQLTDSQLNSD